MLRINRILRARHWFWGVSIGIGLAVVVVVCVLLYANGRPTPQVPSVVISDPNVAGSSSLSTTTPKVSVEAPPLPSLKYPPGSVEEACGLNELPPYWNAINNRRRSELPSNAKVDWEVLESEECRTALDNHVKDINPYLWGSTFENRQFSFVVLEEKSLTFERIFADPEGDLIRVQDALSRPECLLKGDESNWELEETCHAEAFLNYALIGRFCFDNGVSNRSRTMYWKEDNPTPEQDRFMWKQLLENDWVRAKCEELSPKLELTKHHQELTNLLLQLGGYDTIDMFWDPVDSFPPTSRQLSHREMKEILGMGESTYLTSRYLVPTLIEMAARLGDDEAGLTQPFTKIYSHQYLEEGYKHGRFSWLLTNETWRELSVKQKPSADHFLRTFYLLARVSAHRPDPRAEFEFDWEWVTEHLCSPPYYHRDDWRETEPDDSTELQNCKEVVHELRQRDDLKFAPLLQTLDKFEQVAIELGVYE